MNKNLKSEPLMFIQTVKTDSQKSSNQHDFDSRNKVKATSNYEINQVILKVKKLQKVHELGFEMSIKIVFSDEEEVVGSNILYDNGEVIFENKTYSVQDIKDIDIVKIEF